jgi:hypothetical protein
MSQVACRGTVSCAAVVVTFGLLLGSSSAVAASRTAREREARKACLKGDYAKGVGILADLFVETMDATYIFNQGRCFEQNRRYEDAVGRFDEFLRAAGKLGAEDRAMAEEHIVDCKRKLAEERANSTQATPQTFVVSAPRLPRCRRHRKHLGNRRKHRPLLRPNPTFRVRRLRGGGAC